MGTSYRGGALGLLCVLFTRFLPTPEKRKAAALGPAHLRCRARPHPGPCCGTTALRSSSATDRRSQKSPLLKNFLAGCLDLVVTARRQHAVRRGDPRARGHERLAAGRELQLGLLNVFLFLGVLDAIRAGDLRHA